MKICIPTVTNNGIDSKISGHFGSSPYFVVYNTADSALEVTQNSLKEHIHGVNCPGTVFSEKDIDCVICNGIGGSALDNFINAGIKVYKAEGNTIAEALANFENKVSVEIAHDSPYVHRKPH